MKTEKEKLYNWLIHTIQNQYADDIALVIVHDHLVLPQDDFKKVFDYFVPVDTPQAEARARELARTFIIHDIGFDLYPRSWQRLEGMARLEDFNTNILADARILYSRTPEEANRFRALQETLRSNLKNSDFMQQKALEYLKGAMDLFNTMVFKDDLSSLRLAAGYIGQYLSISTACLNHTYLKNSQEDCLDELAAMPLQPEGLLALLHQTKHLTDAEDLKKHAYQMISITRTFLQQHTPTAPAEKVPGYSDLAAWYEELSYTWRRIRHFCQAGDAQRAFIWGVYLQSELNVIHTEFRVPLFDILSPYRADDLSGFAASCNTCETQLLDILKENGTPVVFYDSVDAFLQDNEAL